MLLDAFLLGLGLYWLLMFTPNLGMNSASIKQLVAHGSALVTPTPLAPENVSIHDMRFDICYAVNTSLHQHGFAFIETRLDVSMHIAVWFKYIWNTSVVLLTLHDDASYLNMHLHSTRPSIDNIVIVRFVGANSSAQKNHILDSVLHSWVVVVYLN